MNEVTKAERAALENVERLDEPDKLKAVIRNARMKGSKIVEAAAFRRLCLIQPEASPGTVEHDVWQAIFALEEMLSMESSKTKRLSRTRQKIAKHGEAKTAADLTLRAKPSDGFHMLVERGHPELLFEVVVLRHPKTFDNDVRDAARSRLSEHGIHPEQFEMSEVQ